MTASTIRRDLALHGQVGLARTYGGAMAMGAHPEASVRQRTGEAFEQKHTIARWAAALILPGENILLDADSTVGALGGRPRSLSQSFVGPLTEAHWNGEPEKWLLDGPVLHSD